jgi:hypothetical protein
MYTHMYTHQHIHTHLHTRIHIHSRLYLSRLATIAAIRGACPAGGCMMSMCCDHRVMSSVGSIGLNEVQLGIREYPGVQCPCAVSIVVTENEQWRQLRLDEVRLGIRE